MYILPQILNISSENSLINSLIDKIKEKLAICIEKFIFSNIKNRLCQMCFHSYFKINYKFTNLLNAFLNNKNC